MIYRRPLPKVRYNSMDNNVDHRCAKVCCRFGWVVVLLLLLLLVFLFVCVCVCVCVSVSVSEREREREGERERVFSISVLFIQAVIQTFLLGNFRCSLLL